MGRILVMGGWFWNGGGNSPLRTWYMHVTDVVFIFHFIPPKKQFFLKMKKKTCGDIIILHMCTKNYDHIM